ncbi:MAG: 5'/3'-nucleotidase SurE [Bacteroidales bacterium]|nr:5'/3'-nucleotidase SurE [Bacteroidales bacterium]
MNSKPPAILITNDDGIFAPGLRTLIKVMRTMGNVTVVAPDRPMSGSGHAITVRSPLRLHLIAREEGYAEYSCNGTPVDCVKLGEQVVLKAKPDLLVSGINHGSNAAINIIYSGTMAAVLESAIGGVPSIGFSLLDYSHNADFSGCEPFIRLIAGRVIEHSLPDGICLNVNIPALNGSEIKGVKICRQGRARWVEEFDTRTDPHKREYHWLTGYFEKLEENDDTDQWALENHYVSVVPVHFDLTAHYALNTLQNWNLDAEKG